MFFSSILEFLNRKNNKKSEWQIQFPVKKADYSNYLSNYSNKFINLSFRIGQSKTHFVFIVFIIFNPFQIKQSNYVAKNSLLFSTSIFEYKEF